MIGGVEASVAAGEILALLDKLIAENKDKPDVLKALEEVKKKATEIKTQADAGWY